NSNKSAWSLAHLAYAEAIIGLKALALEDLDCALQVQNKEEHAQLPEWIPWIRDFCRYDQLALAADKTNKAPLAALLRLTAVHLSGHPTLIGKVGPEVFELLSESEFACTVLLQSPKVEQYRRALEQSRKVFATQMYDRIKAIPELPDPVTEKVNGAIA